jgi:demethylmacrocin O-methyltransferase
MSALKAAATRTVKPLVGDRAWQRLRRLAGREPAPQPSRPRYAEMSLTEIGLGTGTDKARTHSYTQHYERYLRHLRHERFTLLEIGIGGYANEGRGGRSLRMWKRYFPRARIVGLDIEDKSFVDRPRIVTYQGSQVDEEVLRRIVAEQGTPRVVIDDGSHRPEHVRETFRILFPLLADDGIYAIEDTQTSYWTRYGGSHDRHAPDTTMALVKDLLDGLNHAEFADPDYEPTYADRHVVAVHAFHNLVIIEKGHNDEPSNRGVESRF